MAAYRMDECSGADTVANGPVPGAVPVANRPQGAPVGLTRSIVFVRAPTGPCDRIATGRPVGPSKGREEAKPITSSGR